jgi:hypothetical protein
LAWVLLGGFPPLVSFALDQPAAGAASLFIAVVPLRFRERVQLGPVLPLSPTQPITPLRGKFVSKNRKQRAKPRIPRFM